MSPALHFALYAFYGMFNRRRALIAQDQEKQRE